MKRITKKDVFEEIFMELCDADLLAMDNYADLASLKKDVEQVLANSLVDYTLVYTSGVLDEA